MGPLDSSMIAGLYAALLDVVLLKGTGVVLAAAVACLAFRRSSAALRHGIWAAAFLSLLALCLIRPVGPATDLTIVGLRPPPNATGARVTDVAPGPAIATRPAARATGDPVAPVVRDPRRRTLTAVGTTRLHAWVVAIWLVGLLLHLARFGAHLRAARALGRRAEPCPDRVRRRVRAIAARLNLRRVPTALVSPEVAVPGTFGIIRPTVILPRDAGAWSDERLEAALLHEMAHLGRRDYLTHLVAACVKAAYWMNPVVWWAGRRLEAERERACDDGAVAGRIDAIRYAEHLLSFAWSGREGSARPLLPLVGRSSLSERIRSLLDRAQARTPLGRGARTAIAATATLAVLAAGSIEGFGAVQGVARQVAGLSSPDPLERRRAAWSLGEAEDPAALSPLIERLADPDPTVRAVAAWALGEIKHPDAVEPLVALLGDPDARVREMAALAIGEIEEPTGLAPLREAGPAAVSDAARRWAISQIEGAEAYPEVFAGSLAEPRVRASDLPRYLEELRDPVPRVRAVAAEKLGLLGAPEAVEPLLGVLEDPDAAVRAAAVWALDEINPSRPGRSGR